MGRLGRLGLEPAHRYERSRPGELIHIDVKKLGRIAGVGHRMSGDRASQNGRYGRRKRGELGWEYVLGSEPRDPKAAALRAARGKPATR